MKVIRVHNPSGLKANSRRKRKVTTIMATKRRKRRRNASVGRPRRVAAKTVNPRRRRRRARRNPTTIVARSRSTRRTINPRRTRRSRRRSNPSAMRVGSIFKDMVYGAGGAIATRAIGSIAEGFAPSSFAQSPLLRPGVQAITAVTVVRWLGKKFLGQKQADLMMGGGLISAGLALADVYLPNAQAQLTSLFQTPLGLVQPQSVPALGGYRDVYEIDRLPGQSQFAGFSDVEEVPVGIWG